MMKKALKLTFGTVVAISSISNAYADWEFLQFDNFLCNTSVYVTGTWYKPSNNGISYGDVLIAPGQEDRVSSTVFVEPDHEFDWGAGLFYHLPNTHTRIYFNYDHYSDTSDEGPTSDLRNIDVRSPVNGATTGSASVHHRTNEYALGLSYIWERSDRFYLDWRAQLAWEKYERDFDESITSTGGQFGNRHTHSELRGFGPGVGVMAHVLPFTHCNAFGVFAGGIASVLWGKNEFNALATDQNPAAGGVSYGAFPDNSRSAVTKLDIKFGIDWNSVFAWDQYSFDYGLALGMRYMNVANAFKNGNSYFNPVNDGIAGAVLPVVAATGNWALNTGFPNDFGRFGPFLQFHLGAVNPI